MRPGFEFETKYRVTMLSREERTRGLGTPTTVKGLMWYTDGSKARRGIGAGDYGQSLRRRLSMSMGKYAIVVQAEMYAILTVRMKFLWTLDQRSTLVLVLAVQWL